MNEHHLLTLLRPLAAPEAEEFKNDAAALTVPPGKQVVVTSDTLIESVHFVGDEPAGLIAQKALRVNISDLAAMGAAPYRYSLALSLPAGTSDAWLGAFVTGLAEDQKRYDVSLIGGDTTATPGPLTVTVSMVGLSEGSNGGFSRGGAKPGDGVYVTGTLGEAALGLRVAHGELEMHEALLARYQLPEPRLEAIPLLQHYASAVMDISDGLAQDLGRICELSKVGAEIDSEALPLPNVYDEALYVSDIVKAALYGGDDYELLFTAPAAHHAKLTQAAAALAFPITKIGDITDAANGVTLLSPDNRAPLTPEGYVHTW